MKIYNMGLLKNRIKTQDIKNTTYSLADKNLLSLLGLDINTISSSKLGEVVFFTCLNFLSSAVGKLPLSQYTYDTLKGKEKVIDNSLGNILNLEPNPYMSASSFWSCIELNRNFYGNCYVYISTSKAGKVDGLWVLDTEDVTVWRDTAGIFGTTDSIWYVWYDRNNNGKKYTFSSSEILHYKTNISFDGIMGLAVKDILSMQIDTQKYGQSYINNLYKSNMFGDKVILQYTADLDTNAKDELVKGTERYCNTNSTRFLPLPIGITATTLSMKLSDAEFSLINNTNALRIASAFSLSPNVINDYSKSSYANSVSQQTDFYVNCLMPILQMYKQENTRKILSSKDKLNGNYIEHETRSMFKLNPTEQMQYLKDGINNMLITPQEGREELGLPYIEGADVLIGNGNLITLEIIKSGANYNKNSSGGGDNNNGK